MVYLNIPADFQINTIQQYYQLNQCYSDARVIETYGQINDGNNKIGSGRPGDLIPKSDWKLLENYVSASKKYGIDFNYTLNATCLSNMEFTEQGTHDILTLLRMLNDIGVSSITVAIPSLIEIVRSSPYHFDIKASTLCQINNVNKAKAYEQLGAGRIVLDESINRDFASISRIRKSSHSNIELIANVICHRNCIYRTFHQNQCAHDADLDQPSTTFYTHRCMQQRLERPGDVLRLGWIRPEDLTLYEKIGIEYFKIQGRHTIRGGDPVRTVEAYMKREFDGNLLELLDMFHLTNSFSFYLDNKQLDGFLAPYYENSEFCKLDCDSCNYCDNYIKKCVDSEEAETVRRRAMVYYRECDPVRQLVRKTAEQQGLQGHDNSRGIADEFDFEI